MYFDAAAVNVAAVVAVAAVVSDFCRALLPALLLLRSLDTLLL